LVAKAVPDVVVEVGALRLGGDPSPKDGVWDGEVAIDRATAEFQLEGVSIEYPIDDSSDDTTAVRRSSGRVMY
jgi:hypothetical protein